MNSDRKPVANARIWANCSDGSVIAEGSSDADGRFSLGPIEPLNRQVFTSLHIEASGYAVQYVGGEFWSIFPGADYDLGTIRIDHGRVFSGQVIDMDGIPQHGAKVLCQVHRHSGYIGLPKEIATDAEGRFRTPPLPVGILYMKIRSPDRQVAWHNQPVQPGGEEILPPFRLENDIPIHGKLLDERGQPIVGATIDAFLECQGSDSTVSGPDGNFTLRTFKPNPRFQFQVLKEGYVTIDWLVRVSPEGFRWQNMPTTERARAGENVHRRDEA